MRVNVYAEEMTNRIEIISKEIEGQTFTGLRFYLELPASFLPGGPIEARNESLGLRPATIEDRSQALHFKAPFIHRPGDDDSSAVTFWGKRDLRSVLWQALTLLDEHYENRAKNAVPVQKAENK